MTARRTLIAGNWKMNGGDAAGRELAKAVAKGSARCSSAQIVIAPPAIALAGIVSDVAGSSVEVACQNVHQAPKGAFTGEASVGMAKQAGAKWVIVGHSERRQYFNETDETVALKTQAVQGAGLQPIVCVGETLAQREAGKTNEVCAAQVDAFVDIIAQTPGVAVIAYEPVWAIGTGKVATTDQAQVAHAAIRAHLGTKSSELAGKTRILYGGSMKPGNAEALLACPDIDGGLIGGASLMAEDFLTIAGFAG